MNAASSPPAHARKLTRARGQLLAFLFGLIGILVALFASVLLGVGCFLVGALIDSVGRYYLCSVCRNQVSKETSFCPGCGSSFKRAGISKALIVLFLLALALVLGLVVSGLAAR